MCPMPCHGGLAISDGAISKVHIEISSLSAPTIQFQRRPRDVIPRARRRENYRGRVYNLCDLICMTGWLAD